MQADRPLATQGAPAPARGAPRYRSAAAASHMFRKSGWPSSHVTAAASHVAAASSPALSPVRVSRPFEGVAGNSTDGAARSDRRPVHMFRERSRRVRHVTLRSARRLVRRACGRTVGGSARGDLHRCGQSRARFCCRRRRRGRSHRRARRRRCCRRAVPPGVRAAVIVIARQALLARPPCLAYGSRK